MCGGQLKPKVRADEALGIAVGNIQLGSSIAAELDFLFGPHRRVFRAQQHTKSARMPAQEMLLGSSQQL